MNKNISIIKTVWNIRRKIILSICLCICTFSLFAQNKITGKITDANGEVVVGASVMEKGTSNGVMTDQEGNFSFTVAGDAVLQISYIGYISQEVTVGNRTSLDITLVEDSQALEEVVVVGYGTQKKASLTGAVSAIDGNVTRNKPATSVLNALQGTIPGMNITHNQGTPGSENWDFQIRGASSLNGSTPLVIIDDIPYADYKKLNTLNANDIESISVLKDASAAIYGARAAGGVVLITTKKGQESKPTFNYNGQFIYKTPGMLPDATSRQQYGLMIDEGNKNDDKAPGQAVVGFLRDWDYWMNGYDGAVTPGPLVDTKDFTYADNNWKDILFGDAFDNAHNVSVSGRTAKHRYFASGGFHQDNGYLNYGDTRYNRLNLRTNNSFDINDKIKAEVSLAFEKGTRHLPTLLYTSGSAGYATMQWHLVMPNLAFETPEGRPYGFGGTKNPATRLRDGGEQLVREIDYHAKIKFDYTPIKDLVITVIGANDGNFGTSESITKEIKVYSWDESEWAQDPSYASSNVYKESNKNAYANYTAYFNYKKAFDLHDFSLMSGVSYEEYEWSRFWARRYKLISTEVPSLNMGESTEQYNGDSYESWKIASYFGRFNYAYNRKYLFEANARYDGSSRFAPTHRYEWFGGASAGWVLSEEDFLKDNSFINFLKLRASYGSTGNQNGIGLYDYLQLINLNNGSTVFGETGTRAGYTALGGIASTERTWERINNLNFGLDFAVLKNRLSASFDYYIKRNSNMLIASTLPSILGVTPPTMNIGDLKTWGWDLTVTWRDKAGSVNYFATVNLQDNQNKLVDLKGSDNVSAGWVTAREGYPINSLFGYESEGVMKTQAEVDEYKKMSGVQQNLRVGDIKFKDVSGNGAINPVPDKTTGDAGDLIYLGSSNIRYVYSLSAGFEWKGIDFSFLLQGQLKQDRTITGIIPYPGSAWYQNQDLYMYNKWYNPTTNPDGKFGAVTTTGDIASWDYRSSTLTHYNNRFGRMKAITLGYTLPKAWFTKIKIEQLRVYFNGNDLFEFKSYPYPIDPESNAYGLYPINRSCTIGIDITF